MSSNSKSQPILVLGHRNPDMDAIAAAIGYAYLLDHIGPEHYEAGRLGDINAQTNFALTKFGVDAPPFVADVWTRVSEVVEDVPAKNLPPTPSGLVLKASDTTHEVRSAVQQADHKDFPVVDAQGKQIGVAPKAALLDPPRRKVVLVDHNEPQQAVPGIEDADMVEVLDHHRLGNLPTTLPIRFYADVVGSTSTLVTERYIAAGIDIPAPIAGILLSGLLSDTLVFRSPTTTPRDKKVGEQLAQIAGVQIDSYGNDLLAASGGLGTRPAAEIVRDDLKFYEANAKTAGVTQVELMSFAELPTRLDDLQDALQKLVDEKKLTLGVLMVTDVTGGNSHLVVAGQTDAIAGLPYKRLEDGTLDAPGMLSRKKQLLPVVLETLGKLS